MLFLMSDKYLPVNGNFNILEIGGAPGQFLVYMAKNFKYHLHSPDYSMVGNDKTLRNLAIAHIPVQVYERSVFEKFQ